MDFQLLKQKNRISKKGFPAEPRAIEPDFVQFVYHYVLIQDSKITVTKGPLELDLVAGIA